MTEQRSVIRTPWRIRWRRWVIGYAPLIVFLLGLSATFYLWDRQGASAVAMGRAEIVRVEIVAVGDGILSAPATGTFPREFQPVEAGQIVARIDDSTLRPQLAAVRSEVVALQEELNKAQTEAHIGNTDRHADHLRLLSELAREVEQARLEIIDRHGQLREDELELSRISSHLSLLEQGKAFGLTTRAATVPSEKEKTHVMRLAEAHKAALNQARENYRLATERRGQVADFEPTELESVLRPIRASIAAAEARVAQVQALIDGLSIRSPVSGTVAEVYCSTGQGVRRGDTIMSVVAERCEYVVAYLPTQVGREPSPGMAAKIKKRASRGQPFETVVESVAKHWSPIPVELTRDQNKPEMGLAVRLPIPTDMELRPGELVSVTFLHRSANRGGPAGNARINDVSERGDRTWQ